MRLFLAWVGLGLFLTVPAVYYLRAGLLDPSVNVRWSEEIDEARRAELEARFGLADGAPVDPPTWSYRLRNTSRSNLSALIAHSSVVDTHKINRATLEVEGTVPYLNSIARAAPIGFGSSAAVWLGVGLFLWARRVFRRVRGHVAPAAGRVFAWLAEAARRWESIAALAMGAYFLAPLLLYGPYDHEESGLGFFSSQFFYRELVEGRWTFWLNDLGFGTPMPIGQRFDFHPVFALGSLVSLRAAVSATWVVHVVLMIVYFRRLAGVLGIGPLVRTGLTACYLFSAPSLNYFHATDWLSVAVAWSTYPALVYCLHRTLTEAGGPATALRAVQLALVGAFWVLNSHPGYIPPLALILGFYVLLVARPRVRVYGCLIGACVLGVAASSERVYFLVSEAGFFPSWLSGHTQGGNTLYAHALAAAVPFTRLSDGLREPFIGLVIGAAAAASALVPSKIAGTRSAGLAFMAALAVGFLPLVAFEKLRFFSGAWFFRDPMVFFGLLAAGVVLQRGIEVRQLKWRLLTVVLLGAQLLQQSAAMLPGFQQVAARGGPLRFYRHQDAPVGLAGTLVERARSYGSRLYTSEPVRRALRGGMSTSGIHSITDLVFFGINPINGWFKNVSMDRIHPSAQLMHGVILGQPSVIAHQPLLDVLGINLVWARAGEGPFPPGLVVTDRWPVDAGDDDRTGEQDLMLLANPTAWPRAVFLTEGAGRTRLPLRPGCPHVAAMCRDFRPLTKRRLTDQIELTESNGLYHARFSPSGQGRLLFVSATYRPEWQVTSAAGPLVVERAAGAFLGVTIPAGVREVEIRFEPRARVVLAYVSYGTMLTLLGVVCLSAWRRRRRALTR